MEFKDRLHEAGALFDGHVTNGSLAAQVEVVRDLVQEFAKSIRSELKAAGDLGRFREELKDEDRPYPEYVAIEMVKKVEEQILASIGEP